MEQHQSSASRGDAPTSRDGEGVQRWALYTAAGGVAGAAFGATSAFVRGQPTLFMASAFGVNATIFTGALLGLRAALLCTAPALETVVHPGRVPVVCSAVAAAAVGTGFTVAVSGRNRALPAMVLWGCVGWAGQSSVDAINAWRRSQALALIRANQDPAQRKEAFTAVASLTRAADAGAVLVSDAPGADVSTSGGGSRRWDWMPFHFGNDHSARLTALRRRLQEINEDLGEADPQPASVSPPRPLSGAAPEQ